MKTSLRAPTRYEQERIEALKRLGCVACAVLGVPNLNHLELHHILSGGVRMGHWFTIFLCRGHHQGDWSLQQLEWIEQPKRVAISHGRKRFNRFYGTEQSLWIRCQEKLKLSATWPATKVLPRRLRVASTEGMVDRAAHQADAPADVSRSVGVDVGDVRPGEAS